jgi:hypothetical protein
VPAAHTLEHTVLDDPLLSHLFRFSIDFTQDKTVLIKIDSIKIDDEGIYLCEITYLEVLESCNTPNEYQTDLKIVVPPSRIFVTHWSSEITDGKPIGPLKEGHQLNMTCEVQNTRPKPEVGWYRAGDKLPAHEDVSYDDNLKVFTVKTILSLKPSRKKLKNTLEYRVKTIEKISLKHVNIDLQVRPVRIHLSGHVSGVKSHVVEGSKVSTVSSVWCSTGRHNSSMLIDDSNELTTISTKTVRRSFD